ncbi:hypothetical protein DRQ21_09865 [Candidatus Fermentibacteria bacterium]|nr:MAG: hypothetical protein DRQ21_09865 [Candidatus Fermentibacteria bacterium]
MALRSVFQGHWRALENRWLSEYNVLRHTGSTAVITAGQSVAARLMGMITGEASGTRFMPGFPALAEALAVSLSGQPVPRWHLAALACRAGYRPESAEAAVSFFEKLIEMGVSAEIFRIVTQSTRGLHPEVIKTADSFASYFKLREQLHPSSPDRIFAEGPVNTRRFETYMFYGFYDLNPRQRAYIEKLSESADVVWFSPVHPSHHWRKTSARTTKFLMKLCTKDIVRVDGGTPLSPMAQFAENLLTGKVLSENAEMQLLRCSSGMGLARAVTNTVQELLGKYAADEIAVVSTGEDSDQITAGLHSAGIPCASPVRTEISSLPAGRFIERLLDLPGNNFHHKDIEKLLLTGVISMHNTPDAGEYAEHAGKTGARFGLNSLRQTGFPFAGLVAEYFQKLPPEADPEDYRTQLMALVSKLCEDSVPRAITDSPLQPGAFKINSSVTFDVFTQMVRVAMDTTVNLREANAGGIAVLSPEKARGILKKAIVLTGMEEGVFPRKFISDPRLPAEIREQLQLPSLDLRETDDAFLLRQVFEAAGEKLTAVCRNIDASGRPLALSPFLAPLSGKHSPVKEVTVSNSPLKILDIPRNPPFLVSSTQAQLERLRYDPENPSPDSVHCGMIGSGIYKLDKLYATVLENYIRDPFSFLRDRVWKVKEAVEFPVSSEPEPLTRGNIVHRCIETVLEENRPVDQVVKSVCLGSNLTALLGSETLAQIWMQHLTQGIIRLTAVLQENKWTLVETEKRLDGTVAGFPAGGRIDLIFRNTHNQYILADIKTGKPKSLKNRKTVTIVKNGLFQLPFYRNLAVQNGYTPVSEALYIHLMNNGSIELRSLTDAELESVQQEFETKVREIVKAINAGDFHQMPEKTSWDARR